MSHITFTSAEEYIETTEPTIWKPAVYLRHDGVSIDYCNHIEVSNKGDVRYAPNHRIVSRRGTAYKIDERDSVCGDGKLYRSVRLYDTDGVQRRLQLHRIVASTFNGSGYKPGLEVHHIDNNPLNNHIDNLKWMTGQENMAIRYGYGNA